jgi:hypothetical protein
VPPLALAVAAVPLALQAGCVPAGALPGGGPASEVASAGPRAAPRRDAGVNAWLAPVSVADLRARALDGDARPGAASRAG